MSAPAIEGLAHWTCISSDIEKAVQFYVDVLGAQHHVRPSGAPQAVGIAGTNIDFFLATDDEPAAPGPYGQHHALKIRLEDYDRWIEHFNALGVPYFMADHGPQRISLYVDDPDGYHLELTVGVDEETGKREIEKRGIKTFTSPH